MSYEDHWINNPNAPSSHDAPPAPILAQPEPSPTHGMTLGDRIAHVGGRVMPHGYIEFGSLMAVNALIQHVLRDVALPAPDADEDEALRNRLAYLLAGVAVALKGPEPALTRWSYADLPEIAAKAMIELEIYRQQAGPDRLDAQRWQQWMKSFETTSGTQWAFDAMSAETAEEFTAAIDAAIATGGQP